MSNHEIHCKHTFEMQYKIFDAYLSYGRNFKFFMPCNVCTQCQRRISGVPNDTQFFYNAMNEVFNEYSNKFKKENLYNLW